ncbi:MAG: hypothetical protein HY827_00085 [Actinobacteria bacterium]|nr:hypothetical protein [Actinomycetota bacterium]
MDTPDRQDGAKPPDPTAGSPVASAAAGAWAVRASVLAVVSFGVLILLSLVADVNEGENSDTLLRDLAGIVRFVVGLLFAIGGVGALGLSLRAMSRGERSVRLFVALAIGLITTGFFVAEFTVLE